MVLLATGCYVGRIPIASGTFGTLVSVPLCYPLSMLGAREGVLFIALFIGFAIWISTKAERIFRKKDSSLIVIDEMAGFLVTLFLLPWSVKTVVIGFLAFRLMDILKPFPIRRLESGLPGGWGVVGDDVLAGIYANFLTRFFLQYF